MGSYGNRRLEQKGELDVFRGSVLCALIVLYASAPAVPAQTQKDPVGRVIVTFDCSYSMQRFPHDRLNDYAARILLEGISRPDIDPRDKWAVRAGVSEDLFKTPLRKPGWQTEVYKFAKEMKRVEIPVLTRPTLIAAGITRRDCGGKTDIASVVEHVCRISEKNWDDAGRTYWIFVSDDKPGSTHQTNEQAQRLRALELVYEWGPLLVITVGDYDNPPLVEIREVQNRLYKRYVELIEGIPGADEKKLQEIQSKLSELRANITRILQDKDLPRDLVRDIEERINNLGRQADNKVYELKLGLFDLTQPGATLGTSRFVEPEPIRFSWTKPPCDGVSQFTVRIRDLRDGSVKDQVTGTTEVSIPGLKKGSYEWTVVAQGKSGLSAPCSTTRTENGWRAVRVWEPIGEFQLTKPDEGRPLIAGGIDFAWTQAKNAETYTVEITPPAGAVLRSRRDVYYMTEPISQLGKYTWRVVAAGPDGFPVRTSGVRSFTVGPEIALKLLLPAANASGPGGMRKFEWTPVLETKLYAFELKLPSGTVQRNYALETPTWAVNCTEIGAYQWRAGCVRGDKEARWADEQWRQFVVTPFEPPVLIVPGAGEVLSSAEATFTWKSVENADAYELIVQTEVGAEVKKATVTDTKYTLSLPNKGRYRWMVTALDTKNKLQAPATEGWRGFQIMPLVGPSLISPGADEVLSPPKPEVTFTWKSAENADKYELIVQTEAGTEVKKDTVTDTKYTLSPPNRGKYRWMVTALDTKNNRRATKTDGWRVLQYNPPTFGLLEPPDSARAWPRGGAIPFAWERSPNAQSYRLEIQQEGTGKKIVKECKEEKASVALEDNGLYHWTVYALGGSGTAEIAAKESRKVGVSDGVAPEPVRPVDGARMRARGGKMTFRWVKAKQTAVESYAVRLYRMNGEQAEELPSQSVTASQTQCDVNLPAGEYTWLICAQCDQGISLESATKPRFHVVGPGAGGGSGLWYVVLIVVVLAAGAGVFAFWSRSLTAELAVLSPPGDQKSTFCFRGRGGPGSRVYLFQLDDDGAQCFDVGAKDHYIERSTFGLSLYGPVGRVQRIRLGEEFNVQRDDGKTLALMLSKPSTGEDGLPGPDTDSSDGQTEKKDTLDFENDDY